MAPVTTGLAGRVALITGAGRGLGRSHALLLAERGADVIVNDAVAERCAETVALVRARGRRAHEMVCDITDVAGLEAAIAAAMRAMGRIDILVNNAGIPGNVLAIEAIDEATFDLMIAVKIKGSFFAAQAVIPGMKSRRWGRIINIASNFAMEGSTTMSHYTAAAAALLGFTKSWARELASWNICVNAVAPALVETELTIGSMGGAQIAAIAKRTPLGGRLADPIEISYAVAWLASAEADLVTGQLIAPNGGLTIVGY